jgi:hypothetical protein
MDAQAPASNDAPTDPDPTIPPPEPSCPVGIEPLSEITVVTVIHKTEISEDCYAVPAGEEFTIVFVNQTESLSGEPIPLGLSIYRSPAEAYTGYIEMGAPAYTGHVENALFRGEDVPGLSTGTYQVPALPAGTYWMQYDHLPDRLHAWLVVA